MNRMTAVFLLISCFFFIIPAGAEKPLTIIDYYNSFYKNDPLIRKDGQWVKSIAEPGPYGLGLSQDAPFVLDIQNGYIEFQKGGGGGVRTQHVLFLKNDGMPFIGNSRDYSSDGVCDFDSSFGFFENINGEWKDVTSKVMPKLDYTFFLMKNFDKKKYNDNVLSVINKYSNVSCNLPRYGLKVRISYGFKYGPSCWGSKLQEPELSVLKGIDAMDIFRVREMEWDAKTGSFKLLD